MHPDTLKYVACPGRSWATPPCLGALELAHGSVPPTLDGERGEIVEAVCACSECGAEFPVVAGMLVLVPDMGSYLRGSYLYLKRFLEDRSTVSATMLGWLRQRMLDSLQARDEQLLPPQPGNEPDALTLAEKWTGAYLWAHFERRLSPQEAPHVVQQMLDAVEATTPHSVLESMAQEHLDGRRRLAVDAGCSVGGFTARLAEQFEFVLGVDLSFDKLLEARRLLRHHPTPLGSYRFYDEGNRWVERPIAREKVPNLEFVLASALRLPVATDACDLAASINLIDIVDDPGLVVAEMQRVLRAGGLFLVASPYLDTNKAVTDYLAKDSSPAQTVRRLVGRSCSIVEEVDDVPWVIRNSRRRLQLFLDHCLAAVKR